MKVRILSSLSLISIMFGLLFGIPVQVEASTSAGESMSNDLVDFLGLERSWVDGIDQAYLVMRGIEGEPIGCDTPGTPVLISPTNASTIGDNTPTFNWEIASSSYEYQIQVDNNPDFISPEIDAIVMDTNYTPGTPLSDDTYHWHVRGHNTGGECNEWGDWSDSRVFTIDTTTVIADFSADPFTLIATEVVTFTNETIGDFDTCNWDFGDGGTSPDCSPAPYTYITSGVYTVTLTASGTGGEDTEIKPDYITVYEPVTAAFLASDTEIVEGDAVTFTNQSTGDYDTCSWDFGDGGTSTDCTPTAHTYTTDGVYTVSLTASGNGGEDTKIEPDYITVHDAVMAQFSGTPLTLIDSGNVTFTNQTTGEFDTCSWTFGDGGTSTVCDISGSPHNYASPGAYTVSLTASGAGGSDTETKTNYINVYTHVTAAFSASDTEIVEGDVVTFTNQSTGDYDTCSWDFGDGGTSADCTPAAHTYNTDGFYTVSLTVSGNGGSDAETKTNYITVYDKVVAEFLATPTSGIAPLEVSFTNESTGDYDTCSWDFGDGGTSSDCDPPEPHTYNSTCGTYTVSLTVSGNGGEDTETKVDYISTFCAVEAEFSATPTELVETEPVTFTNESTGDFDTCSWDFGDGGASSDCDPAPYIYDTHGSYTVTLTVSGNGGEDTEIKPGFITVYEPVEALFSATPTELVATEPVTYTNESTGDFDTCSWSFGDGGTSSVCSTEPFTYTYDLAGTYTVTLTVSGNGGEDTETKPDYITVYDAVHAQFSATPTSGPAPLEVSFTNESTGDYDTCSWDFGDGGTSSDCNPAPYTYDIQGIYTVTLIVSGNGGQDTEIKVDFIVVENYKIYTPLIFNDDGL